MIRALKESLEPATIKTAFEATGVYPWNADLILGKAVRAFPNPKSVDTSLPSPTQEMITAIIEATPRSEKVQVTKFRKHKLESNKIFLLDDMVAHDDEYYKNKDQVELEKKEKARAKKEAAQAKQQVKEEQKKRLQEEREEKKLKNEAADEAAAKRRRQTRCHYCSTQEYLHAYCC